MPPDNTKPSANHGLTTVTRHYMHKDAQCSDASILGKTACIYLTRRGGNKNGFYTSTNITMKGTATEITSQYQMYSDTAHPDSTSKYPISPISYHSHPSVFCKHLLEKACFPETFWNQKSQTWNQKETSFFPEGCVYHARTTRGLQDDSTPTASFRSQQAGLLWSFFLVTHFHYHPPPSLLADPLHSERNMYHSTILASHLQGESPSIWYICYHFWFL